jgi:tetratricopeptide (TPR) repeat protein
VIADPVDLDATTAAKLKTEETYYTKVVAAAHNSIGLLRAEQQDFREASAQFALAAKWNPNQEGLNYNVGLAYYKSESYKEARPALEKELKIDPANIAIKQFDVGKNQIRRFVSSKPTARFCNAFKFCGYLNRIVVAIDKIA